MRLKWAWVLALLKEACVNAFSAPLQIVGKTTDSLTKHVTFSLKAKRMQNPIFLTTREIMQNDKYLTSLSSADRQQVETQYLFELRQPLAYIAEYPISPNDLNEHIFKIFSLEQKKMICGSATYFIKHDEKTLSTLSTRDIVKIAKAHYLEHFEKSGQAQPVSPVAQTNLHYLNLK